jgi:capsular polysaccharide transport system permease protein
MDNQFHNQTSRLGAPSGHEKDAAPYPSASLSRSRPYVTEFSMSDRTSLLMIDAKPRRISYASSLGRTLLGWASRHLQFLLTVMLPTTLVALYLLLIATPQYISEAHFVVHGPTSQQSFSLANLLQSSGSSGSEDTYVVQDYMQSRDAAEILVKNDELLNIFNRPEADFFARYTTFFRKNDFEHFYTYYKRHIYAELDSTTEISTLEVRTFRAKDSQHIARALLDASEALVNEMNRRQRANTIQSAVQEVDISEQRLRNINTQLAAYRNKTSMLDPLLQSTPMLGSITTLQNLLTGARMQLSQLKLSVPSSPLIVVYERQISILEDQISHSESQITGPDTSLVPKITGYDDLVLQRALEERILAGATEALETAKAQANRQMIYVDEVAQPNTPDWPAYPRNMVVLVIVFFSFLGIHVMARLLMAGAREHSLQ